MNDIKIWITGAKGSIGKNLVRFFDCTEYTILATDTEVDVTSFEQVSHFANRNHPDIIINCAALTGFQNCQDNELEAYKVNALGARNCARAAQAIRAKIVHISSDDVFTCNSHMVMNEFDTPMPKTVYGKTKLAGEMFVRELNPKHIIIRSSWIYDASKEGFLMTVIENAKQQISQSICDQQFSSPTSIDVFCSVLNSLIHSGEYGIFHASCNGICSRYEFAKTVLEYTNLSTTTLQQDNTIKDGQYGYTILENLMLKMTDIYAMTSWQEELSRFLLTHKIGGTMDDQK